MMELLEMQLAALEALCISIRMTISEMKGEDVKVESDEEGFVKPATFGASHPDR